MSETTTTHFRTLDEYYTNRRGKRRKRREETDERKYGEGKEG